MPQWRSKTLVSTFWPGSDSLTAAPQLLLRFSDALRVISIPETSEIEITLLFLPSSAGEQMSQEFHTLWIEPVSIKFLNDPSESFLQRNDPLRLALPVLSLKEAKPAPVQHTSEKAKERLLADSLLKIRKLNRTIQEKEQFIRELRAGGIGKPVSAPPPDGESLIEAFKEQYFNLSFEIQQVQYQISLLETSGKLDPFAMQKLKKKLDLLSRREQAWIQKVAQTLTVYRDRKRQVG